MTSSPDDSRDIALTAARRVYDRQLEEIDAIDERAMRTTRTAIIVLGFIAAALTAAGPGVVDDIRLLPLAFIGAGSVLVFTASFVGIGIYSITEYTHEVDHHLIQQSFHQTANEWTELLINRLDDANSELAEEARQNGKYLGYCQISILGGATCLALGTGLILVYRGFGIEPWKQFLGVTFASVAIVLTIRRGLRS